MRGETVGVGAGHTLTSIMASATSRLPLDYATALQPRRQGMGEDSDVMLRGHTGPRRSARLMISALGSHRRAALPWYMLQASPASAQPPILYGRICPMAGFVYMSGADNCDRPLQGRLYGIKQVIVSSRIGVQVLLAIALPAWR
jgi:hypothetical protein